MFHFRCDDYSVRPAFIKLAAYDAPVIAPEVTLRYNGTEVWKGISWHVASYMHQHFSHFGKPPWRESLDIEIRCVAVDGDYRKYVVL